MRYDPTLTYIGILLLAFGAMGMYTLWKKGK